MKHLQFNLSFYQTAGELTANTVSVYDRSTAEKCDRLIIFYPFEWKIYAHETSIYILNYYDCRNSKLCTNPALGVHPNFVFESVCFEFDTHSLINDYKKNSINTFTMTYPTRSDRKQYNIIDAIKFCLSKNLLAFMQDTHVAGSRGKRFQNLNFKGKRILVDIETVVALSTKALHTSIDQFSTHQLSRLIRMHRNKVI